MTNTKTLLEVLQSTTAYFTKHKIENPRLNAEHLLAYALGRTRMELYLEFERRLGDAELVPLRELVWLAQPKENLRRVFYYGYHNDDPKQMFRSSLPIGRILEDYDDLPPVIVPKNDKPAPQDVADSKPFAPTGAVLGYAIAHYRKPAEKPGDPPTEETTLQPGEVITAITVPDFENAPTPQGERPC